LCRAVYPGKRRLNSWSRAIWTGFTEGGLGQTLNLQESRTREGDGSPSGTAVPDPLHIPPVRRYCDTVCCSLVWLLLRSFFARASSTT
jgi:hypothetical protein